MSQLAVKGGEPIRTEPFPVYNTIGPEEKEAAIQVLESGVLSKFLGTHSTEFYGGPCVQRLESDWREYFGVKHAVTMNSATSGLNACIGAAGISPGDEVIVSPYTMTASATCALVYGAIPVFADIDPNTFCITPESIKARLTPLTKAIVVVDILGHPAEMDGIMALAREHGLTVIEDAAQALGATYCERQAGTLGDMGVFSLNRHKAIQTGEGCVVVTNDDDLAERLQLIRNHAEVVVENKGVQNLVNMVGFNYRMTEIEAAIGIEQLKKLERLVVARIAAADYLTEELKDLPGLTLPRAGREIRHGYYLYGIKHDQHEMGVSRKTLVAALQAEGIPMSEGYIKPIYLEPLYQQRIAFGKAGFPFTPENYKGSVSYEKGICPVTEQMYFNQLMTTNVCHANVSKDDLRDVVDAFNKVFENLEQLKETEESVCAATTSSVP